jgi:hypothetical protein
LDFFGFRQNLIPLSPFPDFEERGNDQASPLWFDPDASGLIHERLFIYHELSMVKRKAVRGACPEYIEGSLSSHSGFEILFIATMINKNHRKYIWLCPYKPAIIRL